MTKEPGYLCGALAAEVFLAQLKLKPFGFDLIHP
jgi:hypothetical protein